MAFNGPKQRRAMTRRDEGLHSSVGNAGVTTRLEGNAALADTVADRISHNAAP
jgi:hypothetical protein